MGQIVLYRSRDIQLQNFQGRNPSNLQFLDENNFQNFSMIVVIETRQQRILEIVLLIHYFAMKTIFRNLLQF